MSFFKKSNKWFDKNMNKIIWILLAIQAIAVAIASYN